LLQKKKKKKKKDGVTHTWRSSTAISDSSPVAFVPFLLAQLDDAVIFFFLWKKKKVSTIEKFEWSQIGGSGYFEIEPFSRKVRRLFAPRLDDNSPRTNSVVDQSALILVSYSTNSALIFPTPFQSSRNLVKERMSRFSLKYELKSTNWFIQLAENYLCEKHLAGRRN
jgi:hypothetical protein